MIVNVELVDFLATDGVLNNGYLVNSGSKKIVIATHGMSSNCFKEREKTISTKLNENGIDFFVYNSRGSELVKYVKKIDSQGNETKCLGGTSYEDPKEGYYDILGAIKEMVNRGYEEIYLQGHSLGSTKVLYTYNKLKEENSDYLKFVKGIILLSLVDIPRVLKIYLKERYDEVVSLVKDMKESGRELELMKPGSFIHPISVKSFLCYSIDSEEIDFARYSDNEYNFDKLNNIDVPLFMRWGNNNEMIEQPADELISLLNSKVNNKFKNINYIDGADHGYTKKEDILAKEIVDFLKNMV